MLMHMAATCTTGSRAADDASASVTNSNGSSSLCLAVQCDKKKAIQNVATIVKRRMKLRPRRGSGYVSSYFYA
jgi:hypothetical protein